MNGQADFHKRITQPGLFLPPISSENEEREIPKTIGPYKIESLLEKGGTSLVYLGTHPATRQPVIIKSLMPKYLSHPEMVQRFLTEAEIISMTDHPNIVKLYGNGKWADGLYIAMEFIEGISLRQYIQHAPMPIRKALEVILEIAYALCHLHTHGVIHRDLKPENILVTEEGVVKVIDFGIAQLLNEEGTEQVTKGRFMGTPFYMSPEQKEGGQNISFTSDIYSLGIIAYELILGKPSHGTIHLTLLPKGMQKIISKCLQPDPKDRYQDIVDFISDLSEYFNSDLLGREEKKGDQLTEISEKLQQLQSQLILAPPPEWAGVEAVSVCSRGITLLGDYVDFLTLPDGRRAFFFAESGLSGASGVISAVALRAMVRALAPTMQDFHGFIAQLNKLIVQDQFSQPFEFEGLLLSPQEPSWEYVSCGGGLLWHLSGETAEIIPCRNILLGEHQETQFTIVKGTSKAGDTLVFNRFGDEGSVRQTLRESSPYSTQQLAEAIHRKFNLSKPQGEKPAVVLVLRFI